ncbi:MAG: hypothetical protein CW346_19705 [Bacillaceae bacterium]|nr:hypothetical protein [Bacillaceae bacterium]
MILRYFLLSDRLFVKRGVEQVRKNALIVLWILVAGELMYLFSLSERVHNDIELIFSIILILATVTLGAITVFSLPAGDGK